MCAYTRVCVRLCVRARTCVVCTCARALCVYVRVHVGVCVHVLACVCVCVCVCVCARALVTFWLYDSLCVLVYGKKGGRGEWGILKPMS
jgi:hypothetical protein